MAEAEKIMKLREDLRMNQQSSLEVLQQKNTHSLSVLQSFEPNSKVRKHPYLSSQQGMLIPQKKNASSAMNIGNVKNSGMVSASQRSKSSLESSFDNNIVNPEKERVQRVTETERGKAKKSPSAFERIYGKRLHQFERVISGLNKRIGSPTQNREKYQT